MIRSFRKRPVVIQAEQYRSFRTLSSPFTQTAPEGTFNYAEDGALLINTLEGVMRASDGDWIIRGVRGEFYPCKPEIFATTYEEVAPS